MREIDNQQLLKELRIAKIRINLLLKDKKISFQEEGRLRGEIKFLENQLAEKDREIALLELKAGLTKESLKNIRQSPFIMDIPSDSGSDFYRQVRLLKDAAFRMKVRKEYRQVELYLETRLKNSEYRVTAYSEISEIGQVNDFPRSFYNLIEDLRERLVRELNLMLNSKPDDPLE